MTKQRVQALQGVALDWAVATCEGLPIEHDPMGFAKDAPHAPQAGFWIWPDALDAAGAKLIGVNHADAYNPSGAWAQGGAIIERERIELSNWGMDGWKAKATSYTFLGTPAEIPVFAEGYGQTPLIAAMRCYVASKRGDEIELPEVLA